MIQEWEKREKLPDLLHHDLFVNAFVFASCGMTFYDKIEPMTIKMQLSFCLVSRRRPVSPVYVATLDFEIVKWTHLSTLNPANITERSKCTAQRSKEEETDPTMSWIFLKLCASCVLCIFKFIIYGSLNCQGWDLLSLLWAGRLFSQAWWSICGPRGSEKLRGNWSQDNIDNQRKYIWKCMNNEHLKSKVYVFGCFKGDLLKNVIFLFVVLWHYHGWCVIIIVVSLNLLLHPDGTQQWKFRRCVSFSNGWFQGFMVVSRIYSQVIRRL